MTLPVGLMPIARLRAVVNVPLMGVRLCAGFPSPADDYVEDALDPTRLMVVNPAATFFWRVSGSSMVRAGIQDGDYVVVDRSLVPKAGDVVVAVIDGLPSAKQVRRGERRAARPRLRRRRQDRARSGRGVRGPGLGRHHLVADAAPPDMTRPAHLRPVGRQQLLLLAASGCSSRRSNGVPVIVLSNNDGCAIARTPEAKALGIRMGDPVVQDQGPLQGRGHRRPIVELRPLRRHEPAGERRLPALRRSGGDLLHRRELPRLHRPA